MGNCDRCSKETSITIMSYFNRDILCSECKEKERKHKDFEKAMKAESEACLSGNYNFPGIGKPSDL